MKSKHVSITSPEAMEALGAELAANSQAGTQIHLSGELGAGKTTLVRGFLRGFGYPGKVKSPTYTLVEPYKFDHLSIFHFDFYRINQPFEIESIGYRDYPGDDAICLIEWPEKAGELLGQADLFIRFTIHDPGRELEFTACSEKGNLLI